VGARVTVIEGSSDPKKWGYDPSTVTIKVGAAVEFTNRGSMPHSATHTRGAFDTGMLEKGESVSIRLDDPDTYEYFCHPHPWMKGKIVVEGLSRSGAGAEPGGAAPEEPPPPAVNLWWAGGFVGLLLAAILAAGVAMRRPHRIAAGEWGNIGATGRRPVAANGDSAP
jgi:hypothetical protein